MMSAPGTKRTITEFRFSPDAYRLLYPESLTISLAVYPDLLVPEYHMKYRYEFSDAGCNSDFLGFPHAIRSTEVLNLRVIPAPLNASPITVLPSDLK